VADLVTFPLGVQAPVALAFQFTSTDLDLTTVSNVTLKALNISVAGSLPKTWAASLVPDLWQAIVLPNVGRIIYGFSASGNDLDTKGIWRLEILLSVGGGLWPGDPLQTPTLKVVDQWGRT
jgi:hypothetical protein